MQPKRRIAVVALVGALAAGCLNQNSCFTQTQGPTPVPTGTPTPAASPSPSPSPGAKVSDVDHVSIFVFGYGCAAGTAEPSHGDGIITPNCTSADLTLTPKTNRDADGDGKIDDALNHGDSVVWEVSGTAADVEPGPTNAIFNRLVKVKTVNGVRQRGQVALTARLTDPVGRVHVATKTITVQ